MAHYALSLAQLTIIPNKSDRRIEFCPPLASLDPPRWIPDANRVFVSGWAHAAGPVFS